MPDEEKLSIQLNFRDHLGILYAKSFLKIIAILFILMEFSIGRFPNLFVSLIFLFVVYFSMPTSYGKLEPFKASEAWFRMLVGLFIATTLFLFLSPGTNIFDPFMISATGGVVGLALLIGIISYTLPKKWMVILLSIIGMITIGAIISLLFIGRALPDAAPIFFITLAFLATAPKKEGEEAESESTEGETKMQKFFGVMGSMSGQKMENFGNGIFLTLMLAGGWPIIGWLKGGLQLVLGAVWLMSGLVGYLGGREGRPYIGILMIGFAVLAYSFQFTGTVGTAIFGNYWTPIYNFGSEAFAPLGQSLDAASRQVNYAMCTITAGPGVCDALINPPAAPAGSTQALEFTNFEAVNYRSGTPEINPIIPLIGTIQMENQGDFSASGVSVSLKDPITFDPKKASLNNPTAANKTLDGDSCIFDSCFDGTKSDGDDSRGYKKCMWSSPVGKGDLKVLSFKCGNKNNVETGWAGLNQCACVDPRTGKTMGDAANCEADCGSMKAVGSGTTPGSCKCTNDIFSNYCKTNNNVLDAYCKIEDSACKNDNGDFNCTKSECTSVCNGQAGRAIRKYKDAGWNLRIGFDYAFKYFANVSLPVRVMDKSIFTKKLQNHEITLEDVNPVYSGGPVSVGIWVGKQPIRTDESTIGTIYLQNNGEGIVKAADSKIRLTLPSSGLTFAETPRKITASFNLKGSPAGNAVGECIFQEVISGGRTEKYSFECPLSRDISSGEQGTITFSFKYNNFADASTKEKNTIFVGGLEYTYSNQKNFMFPVVAAPSQ